MTEQDPAATFKLDQEEAETEAKTRDQQSWELNIRNGQAQALAQETHASVLFHKARTWEAARNLVAGPVHLAATALAVGMVIRTIKGVRK